MRVFGEILSFFEKTLPVQKIEEETKVNTYIVVQKLPKEIGKSRF